jgi:2-keto-4-pentenoate hydratase
MVSAFPVIELHHYIFRGSNEIRAAELVANNAIHAGVVMPPAETPLEGDPSRLDRPVRVNRNGELLGRSTGGEHPNGVLSGMVRLAEHLERYGQRLREGQIVLTGSPLPLWRVTAGDHIQVCSDGLSQPAEVVVKERTSETPRPAR